MFSFLALTALTFRVSAHEIEIEVHSHIRKITVMPFGKIEIQINFI